MSTPITPEEIAEARRLDAAATPGPWRICEANDHGHGDGCKCGLIWSIACDETVAQTHEPSQEEIRPVVNDNGRFIALARSLLPRLLDEVERLREQLRLATVDQANTEAELNDNCLVLKRLQDERDAAINRAEAAERERDEARAHLAREVASTERLRLAAYAAGAKDGDTLRLAAQAAREEAIRERDEARAACAVMREALVTIRDRGDCREHPDGGRCDTERCDGYLAADTLIRLDDAGSLSRPR